MTKKCFGKHYNFKKGVEICKHRDVCPHAENDILEVNFGYKYIKDFRNCKLYKRDEL